MDFNGIMAATVLIFDPALRGPFFTCVAMGMLGGLLGVWLFFQRQLLIGEVLSHAIFPGMVGGYLLLEFISSSYSIPEWVEMVCIISGGVISAYLSIIGMQWIIRKGHASEDSALSYILVTTFGISLFVLSIIQQEYPAAWRVLTSLFIGQAATIPNTFAWVSFLFASVFLSLFVLYRRGIYVYLFDSIFAHIHGLMSYKIQSVVTFAVIITAILGARLVGVVLMSAMLTFPPVIARGFFTQIAPLTICSVVLGGILSGGGVLISHSFSTSFFSGTGKPLWIPTGPIIVLLMSFCFLFSLFFSKTEALLAQIWKRSCFYWRSNQENILKFLWKSSKELQSTCVSLNHIHSFSPVDITSYIGKIHYYSLKRAGYIEWDKNGFTLLMEGIVKGERLVRLHRLWELYLVEKCGMEKEKVHPSAEEMEHIITPEMEKELTLLLKNPLFDPHKQPIPKKSFEKESNMDKNRL